MKAILSLKTMRRTDAMLLRRLGGPRSSPSVMFSRLLVSHPTPRCPPSAASQRSSSKIVVWTALAVVVASSVGCLSAPATTSSSSPLSVPVISSAAASRASSCDAAALPSRDPGGVSFSPRVVVSTGLVNCGNTCYLSAQIQCAFHIPRVRSVIMGSTGSRNDESQCADEDEELSSSEPLSVALQSLRQLFRDMMTAASASSSVASSPLAFCRALGIPVGEQQDSQEFWKLLLPAINVSQLTDLYQGAFEDYLVALDGSGRERRREEAFLDLSLDVKPADHSGDDDSYSVLDGLRSIFGSPERLSASEGNGWRPEKGSDPVDAHKGSQLRPNGLPPILQLHLKRFQYDWNTDTTRKLNDPVAFPLTLDLTGLCQKDDDSNVTSDDNDLLYDLQAVVVHAGEYGSGHYYSYVRPNIASDQWYRFNDHVVTAVPYSEVYADARGGKHRPSKDPADGTGDDASRRVGWFGRLWGRVSRVTSLSANDPYGYGGRTSNAYVLQYVKRSDIPLLYGGS